MGETTAGTSKLLAALVKAQAEMEAAKKDSTNPHFKSKYSDLASVAAAIKEPFAKHGLGWRHKTKSDKTSAYVKCVIFHESGEQLVQDDWLELPLTQGTPQAVGSALSYGRRYTLQSEAGLVSDDDDGNAASVHAAKAKPAREMTEGERIDAEPAPYKPHPEDEMREQVWGGKLSAAQEEDDPIINYGKAKGRKVSTLTDAGLGWYLTAAKTNVEKKDPKWGRANQAFLDALEAEADRRTKAGADTP